MEMWEKIKRWWYFHLANPVVRRGEHGGFKWCFRRFWLDIETVSGNFRARFTAAEHPYAYLLAGKNDDNIIGFCQIYYTLGVTMTTDQAFVDAINKAIAAYADRLEKMEHEEEDEEIAIEEVRQVQEYVDAPKKERKKMDRDANGRFKKAVKDVAKKGA